MYCSEYMNIEKFTTLKMNIIGDAWFKIVLNIKLERQKENSFCF